MSPTNPHETFQAECLQRIATYRNSKMAVDATQFMVDSTEPKYSYNFQFLGRPIIQYPQDMVATQQLIWDIKPDLIIETGIAHGGSLIMSASMLALIDYCDAVNSGKMLDPTSAERMVMGIDVDIRDHNRQEIETHPMSHRIQMIEGSSVDPAVVTQVRQIAARFTRVMVLLDSNHTHDHVLSELEAYAPLVSSGSYCIVFDTIIEDLPDGSYQDRAWCRGNNPKTAVWKYLESNNNFEIDHSIDDKLLISVAPHGYLRRR